MSSPAPTLEADWFAAAGEKLHDEIDRIIRDGLNNQPRSLQKRIGPSEIGHPCDRWILHKLAGDEEPPRAQVPWKPAIGTGVHHLLEQLFEREDATNQGTPWWLTERKLTVGYLPNGEPITGSCDLFHVPTGTVVDWKIVGDRQLAHYRANGPSPRYRVQAHTYGGGYMLDPHPWGPPKRVAIYFLPRDRAFEDGYFWHEPWDPQIWGDAINRVNRLWREWDQLGMPAAADLKPLCDDQWCHWCKQAKREAAGSARTSLFQDFPPF